MGDFSNGDDDDLQGTVIPFTPPGTKLEKLARKNKRNGGRASAAGGPRWPDTNEHGTPKKTCANARVAIEALGVTCRYDEFHDRVTIKAEIPLVTDAAMETAGHLLRIEMHQRFGFDPGKDHVQDALVQLALTHRFDPMRDFFDGLQWDGTPRLDRWMTTYIGVEDTELNGWIGRLTLVAAVRRVRQPGCKFDQIPVWEGDEAPARARPSR